MNARKDCAYALLVLAVLCAEAEAQRTWKVSWGDPAADFTDFPPAVAAAKSGDTILVYDHPAQPTGHTYTAAAIDKPLAVVGLYPGSGPGAPNPTVARFKGLFRIRGIPAGRRVVFSNIALWPNYVFQWLPMPAHGGMSCCAVARSTRGANR